MNQKSSPLNQPGFVSLALIPDKQHRELPVFSRIGDQRASGRVDLLLETAEGFVIIDHKTFPGASDTWVEKASEYAPQLALHSNDRPSDGTTRSEKFHTHARCRSRNWDTRRSDVVTEWSAVDELSPTSTRDLSLTGKSLL